VYATFVQKLSLTYYTPNLDKSRTPSRDGCSGEMAALGSSGSHVNAVGLPMLQSLLGDAAGLASLKARLIELT
jgi:hypothetical protein